MTLRTLLVVACAAWLAHPLPTLWAQNPPDLTRTQTARPGQDWFQFLGPTANGISTETGLIDRWDRNGPPRLWSRDLGTGYGAPSVRDGRLVVHHRIADQEIVECLDAATGESQWRYAYPSHFIDPYGYNNGPRSSPVLTTNRCYTFGAEGKLLCLDLPSGKRLWEHDTGAEWQVPEAFFGVGSTPLLENGLLLVMVGGQPNSGIVAFNPETGKVIWESVGAKNWEGVPMTGWPGEPKVSWKSWDKQASYSTPVAATVHGRRLVFCLMRQGLVALDPKDGAVQFSYWFRSRVNESVNASSPIVIDDLVFISAAYYRIGSVCLRIHQDNHGVDPVWRSTALEMHWNTPIYLDGYLYGFSGRNEPDARFRCVEFKTGKLMWDTDEQWRHGAAPPETYGRGSAILADGKLIVMGEAGLLGMFRPSPDRPEEICRFQVPDLEYPCWAAPVIANGRLYLRSGQQQGGKLVCYNFKAPSVAEK